MEIVNDDEGNVWATRGSKNAIFVKVRQQHLLPVVLAVVCFILVSTFRFSFIYIYIYIKSLFTHFTN